jgi:hypothetical protein
MPILFCDVQKVLFPTYDFRFPFHRKKYNPLLSTPLSHLTSSNTTSNSYLANYLATVVSEPDLYRFLTFPVQILMSLFRYSKRAKQSVQARGPCIRFVTRPFFYDEFLAPRPTPKLEEKLLSVARVCLFNTFAATLPI